MVDSKTHLEGLDRTRWEQRDGRRGYLRLDMNENVSGLPIGFVKSALAKLTPDFLSAYPEYKTLQAKIARHNKIGFENICLSNGSDAAIKYIFDAYVNVKDKVLFAGPTFAMYPIYCRVFGAEPVEVAYRSDLSFPEEEFLDRISRQIRLAIIVNPNSPTGSAVEEDALIRIIEKAARNDVLTIVDEAYFYYYPKSVIGLVSKYENLIVLRTFSKLCGLASVRIGYAAACPEIVENLRKVKPTFDVNAVGALLAERILDEASIIETLVSRTNRGRRYLVQRLREEGIEHVEGKANFVLIRYRHRIGQLVNELAKMKILVSGPFEDKVLRGYIRITVADEQAMKKFWSNFIIAWKKIC